MKRFSVGFCDSAALDGAANRVLFSLVECRRIRWEEPGRGRLSGAKSSARGPGIRHVVWLHGKGLGQNTRSAGADADVRLEPGTVWRPGTSEKLVVSEAGTGTTKAARTLGLEFTFGGSLAADYVAFLDENFGRLVRLPPGSRALRAAWALAAAAEKRVAAEVMARRVFGWLSALHEVLEERQVHLKDLLQGRIDHLLPEGAAHGYSVKALAAHLGCTAGWLARRLQHAWRRPAGEVLHALRLRHARELLTTTDASVGEVAWRCGFSSASSFSKAFRREMRTTPTLARGIGREAAKGAADHPSGENAIVRVNVERRRTAGVERQILPPGWEVTPITVWGGAYFQCDGGETDLVYDLPFDVSINTITQGIHWLITLEGHAVFETMGHRINVQPGMVVVYPSPSKGRWLTPSGKPWRRVWVKVRCAWGMEALLTLGAAHGWAATLPLSSRPVKLARKWVKTWNEHRNEPSVSASRSGYEWLLSWWELLKSGRVRPLVATGESGRKSAVLPDMRQAALPSSFMRIKTITGYAKQIGYSRSHTVRKLKEQWKGGTPAQIIRRQRLAQAALDLRRTALPVSEISRRAQFASPGCFIPAFKREFGMTPLEYRQAQF